ncbi:MAG: thioesterase family protein [Actinomycetota bacterium]|nr:thioesterase family protein [Actinomycetota bacterium]
MELTEEAGPRPQSGTAQPAETGSTIGAALTGAGRTIDVGADLWGFGGVHGGLALALVTREMTQALPDRRLRTVGGHFLAAIRRPATIETSVLRRGRQASAVRGEVHDDRGTRLVATALFGRARSDGDERTHAAAPHAPAMPSAPPPDALDRYLVPPEFAPFTVHLDIRPVGDARPFAGGDDPELVAWIRMVEDDEPPDLLRLITLTDALAPSYAAVLAQPQMLPTLALEVRPTAPPGATSSPWVLLRARSVSATADGWVDERIDLWSPDGIHLASADQTRLLVGD